jgi:hypothetical protein
MDPAATANLGERNRRKASGYRGRRCKAAGDAI